MKQRAEPNLPVDRDQYGRSYLGEFPGACGVANAVRTHSTLGYPAPNVYEQPTAAEPPTGVSGLNWNHNGHSEKATAVLHDDLQRAFEAEPNQPSPCQGQLLPSSDPLPPLDAM